MIIENTTKKSEARWGLGVGSNRKIVKSKIVNCNDTKNVCVCSILESYSCFNLTFSFFLLPFYLANNTHSITTATESGGTKW